MTLPLNLQKSVDMIIDNFNRGIVSDDLLEDFYDYFECDGYGDLTDIDNTDFSVFLHHKIMVQFNDQNVRSEFKIPINQTISNNDRLKLVLKIMDDELRESLYPHPLLHSYKLMGQSNDCHLCCINYLDSDIVWYGLFLSRNDFLDAVKKENIWAIQSGHIPNMSQIHKMWKY
jgi:hypothetical protein